MDVTLDNLTIRGSDGGVDATSSGSGSLTLTVTNCVLKSNRDSDGAGILAYSTDSSFMGLVVSDSTFKSNTADDGGAIGAFSDDMSTMDVSVVRSTFKANRARIGFGGAMSVSAGGSGPVTATVDECTFVANRTRRADGSGGALSFAGYSLTVSVVNSVFRKNSAHYGGAIRMVTYDSVSTAIVNSTFRRNVAYAGGAIDVFSGEASPVMTIRNTILWGNIASDGQDLRMEHFGGNLTVEADHSDIGDRSTVSGTFNDLGGNINADPRLTADLHLRADSPAIDTGTCTGAPATDFDGDTRPTGAGCDIGADEFLP